MKPSFRLPFTKVFLRIMLLWLVVSWVSMWPPVCWRDWWHLCPGSCINNLRQIEGAKDPWGLESGLTNGSPVVVQEVNRYVKAPPRCPAGGTYVYHPIGTDAECTLDGQWIQPKRIRTSLFPWKREPDSGPGWHMATLGPYYAPNKRIE